MSTKESPYLCKAEQDFVLVILAVLVSAAFGYLLGILNQFCLAKIGIVTNIDRVTLGLVMATVAGGVSVVIFGLLFRSTKLGLISAISAVVAFLVA